MKTIGKSESKAATRNAPKAEKAKKPPSRNVFQLVQEQPEDDLDKVVAQTLTRPDINAAATIQRWEGDIHEVNYLAKELSRQIEAVNGGDLKRAEGMLIAHAHTLDGLFNNLARRAHDNAGQYLQATETYLRLALKAQSQCRATLETLAAIKNPPVIYARQANVTTGPQQVNNGVAHAVEKIIEPIKLSVGTNELHPHTRTPAIEGRTNPQVETVGEIHRAQDRIRKVAG